MYRLATPFEINPLSAATFVGSACSESDVWVYGNSLCPGIIDIDVAMELYEGADDDDVCPAQKVEVHIHQSS